MSNVNKVLSHAEKACIENGVRLTEKRKQVLSGLLKAGKALSAYELADSCKEEFGSSLPAMSVYRILDFLQEEGFVHKLAMVNKYVACSHITCDHSHQVPQFLICGECQRVEEISISRNTINTLKRNVADAGYQLLSSQLEMHCICDKCVVNH